MHSESKLKLEQVLEKWIDDCSEGMEVWFPDGTARKLADIIENVIDYSEGAVKNATSS